MTARWEALGGGIGCEMICWLSDQSRTMCLSCLAGSWCCVWWIYWSVQWICTRCVFFNQPWQWLTATCCWGFWPPPFLRLLPVSSYTWQGGGRIFGGCGSFLVFVCRLFGLVARGQLWWAQPRWYFLLVFLFCRRCGVLVPFDLLGVPWSSGCPWLNCARRVIFSHYWKSARESRPWEWCYLRCLLFLVPRQRRWFSVRWSSRAPAYQVGHVPRFVLLFWCKYRMDRWAYWE